MLRITEFMPNTKFLVEQTQVVCHDNAMTQDVCSNILFLVAGYNSEQLNKVRINYVIIIPLRIFSGTAGKNCLRERIKLEFLGIFLWDQIGFIEEHFLKDQ